MLVAIVSQKMYQHDPVGIARFAEDPSEYELEAKSVLARLPDCHSQEEALSIVHEEFMHWFGQAAGERSQYVALTSDIWSLWNHRP